MTGTVDFEDLKKELDLEFLFERESLPYKLGRGSSGMQINAKTCPVCGDSKWKVYLNADTGLGNCFKCGEAFNKLTFLKAHFGVEWKELGRVGREVLDDQGWRPRRKVEVAVDHGEIKLPLSTPLPTPEGQNLVYLEQRGVTAELARYFHLSWCEFGWWSFLDEDGKPQRQMFNDRVLIPVYDLDGQLVTFQGRDLLGTKDRKYLFPKGLPGTGRYLLNGHNVRLTKEVAMGEGFFDVAAMKIAFDEDPATRHIVPVGSFGKHLSYGSESGDDQLGRFLKLKAMGVTTVTIMWDGEVKALEAALAAARLLAGLGFLARIARLPFDKDPNEVLPEVVRAAYFAAETWTPMLDVRWRLKNPYAGAARLSKP